MAEIEGRRKSPQAAKVPDSAKTTFGFPATAVPLKDALVALASLDGEAALPWGVTRAELRAVGKSTTARTGPTNPVTR